MTTRKWSLVLTLGLIAALFAVVAAQQTAAPPPAAAPAPATPAGAAQPAAQPLDAEKPAPTPANGAGEKPPAEAQGESSVRNVVLVSWDGADRQAIKELLPAGKLPNLSALAKDGSLRDIQIKGHATETLPGHAEMLTGLAPRTTGVFDNSGYRPIPEGYTIFERVQKALGKDKLATIVVTGKGNHFGPPPPDKSDTGILARAKKSIDFYDTDTREADEVGRLALGYLGQARPRRFLAFFHFRDPDAAGHGAGSGSRDYSAAIVDCDRELGRIVQWLKKEKLYDATLLYVTADHGFDADAHSHNRAPDVWLATNDKLVARGGLQGDIPATVLVRFGLDLSKLNPQPAGRPLEAEKPAPAKGAGEKPPAERPQPAPAPTKAPPEKVPAAVAP